MKANIFTRLVLLFALALPAWANAQARSNIAGTIDTVMLDDGYIVIDGERLVVRHADLVITYEGAAVRASFLSEGQSIRYSVRSDGSVSEIRLIGPSLELDQLDDH